MKTIFNSSEKFNELIFENKNKAYGAYALRKTYKDNLVVSLLFSAGFFGILAFVSFNLNSNSIDKLAELIVPDIDSVIVQEFHVFPDTPIEPEKTEKPKEHTKPPASDDLNLKVTDDKTPTDVKPNELLVIVPGGVKDGDSTKREPEVAVVEKKDDSKDIVEFPDKLPEFDNLQQYIVNHTRYPESAKENLKEGTVYVSFIVELDGTVKEASALNKVGDGLDQEAIRVVKTMKNWRPGIFKGKARRVPVTLPIKFKLK